MPTKPLPQIRKTAVYANTRGRRECWEAQTVDGQWTFVRTEDVGTPWFVYRTGDDAPQAIRSTLRSARAWAAAT